jgi:hypothetical protein
MTEGIGQNLINGLVGLVWVSKESQGESKPAKLLGGHEAVTTREQCHGGLWAKRAKPEAHSNQFHKISSCRLISQSNTSKVCSGGDAVVREFANQALHSTAPPGNDGNAIEGHSVLEMASHDERSDVTGFTVSAWRHKSEDLTGFTNDRGCASLQPHTSGADLLGDTGHYPSDGVPVSMDAGQNFWGERPRAGKTAETLGLAASEGVPGNIGFGSYGEPQAKILEGVQEIEGSLGHVVDVIHTDVHQRIKPRGQAPFKNHNGAANDF